MIPITECGHESWLVDSGATTHVSTSTKMMINFKEAMECEHRRVGNIKTLKAAANCNLILEPKETKKMLQLRNVFLVLYFEQNLISVGRLTEKGNKYVSSREGTKHINRLGAL